MNKLESAGIKYTFKIFILLTLAFVIGVMLILNEACDPAIPLQIENQSSMYLTIYVQKHEAGNIDPNSTIKIKNVPMTLSYYLIEAKNSQDEIIYSKNFSTSELHDLKWRVIITAQQ